MPIGGYTTVSVKVSRLEADRDGYALIRLDLPVLGWRLEAIKGCQVQGRRAEAYARRRLAEDGAAVQPAVGLDNATHDRRPALTQARIDPPMRPTDVVATGASNEARRRGACARTGPGADTRPLPCPLATDTLARLS